MKKAAVALSSLVIMTASMFLGARLVARKPGANGPGAAVADQDAKPTDEIQSLRREVAAVRRMAAASALQVATASASRTPPTPAPAPPPRPSPEKLKAAIRDTLEQQIASEPTDSAWSAERTSVMTAKVAAMPDLHLVSARCFKTLCKLVVEHADLDSQASFMERAAGTDGLDTQAYFLFDKTSSPPRTIAYLARPGESLPRPSL